MRVALSGAAVCLLLVVSACPKGGQPSPEYEQARARFNVLYGEKLEDAYLDPEMAAIEQQLEAVPQESSDHQVAQELLKRIRSGRERLQAEQAERDQALAAARQPPRDFAFAEQPAPEDAGQPQAPDAGAPQPVAGMPVQELLGRFGDCFLPGESVNIVGKGMRSTFVVRETAFCARRHPGFDQRILFIENEKILHVGDKARLMVTTPDAG